MHLLLVSAMALAFQGQPGGRTQRPPAVRDSASANDSTGKPRRTRGYRRAVTPELQASAFKDATARVTLLRARAARLTQDSALTAYDAMSYERISAGLGFTRIGRDRLLFRYENAAHVRWQQGVGVWIDVKGARAAAPIVEGTGGTIDDGDPDTEAAIPYYPGYEPLWVGDNVARAQVDESELVHPIADGAEAYYTYETGDSIRFTLPDKRTIELRELKVRPREPKWNLAVGSLWFDTQSGQLVRAAYRLAIPIDIWQAAKADDPHAMDDVPVWVKPMITPMRAEVTAIAVEYGLHDGRFWLPRLRLAEGRADVSFMHLPFKMEESFTYASVNAKDSLPPIKVDTSAMMRFRPPDSLDDAQARAWRDSVRAVRRADRAKRDSTVNEIERRMRQIHSQCDTSTVTVSESMRYSGLVPVAVRVPCDKAKLAASPDLPPSIYDPGEQLFGMNDLNELKSEALSMAAQAPIDFSFATLPPPSFTYGPSMMRYNRIEGLSVGASVEQQLGGGYSTIAVGRLGLADLEPNVEDTLKRTNISKSIYLVGYNHLVSASDWGHPLSFGSSFSALMFGRDEGFYYKASGVELGGTREASFGGGTRVEWRTFVEQERSAVQKTTFSFAGEFPANFVANRGAYGGVGLDVQNDYGLNPAGFRLFTDARLEAAKGDSAYGRAALDVTASHGLGPVAAALTLSGGSSVGALPTQRRWYLGGSQTIRGQSPDTAQSGNAYWLTRAELGTNTAGLRPTLFGDLGWVGDRTKLSQVGRPLSGVGAGVSFLDGLFRFDVARGIYPRQQFRVDLYLNSKF